MKACEINTMLSARIDSVVEHLLPDGKRIGEEWCIGNTSGDAGKSMGVRLAGDRSGVWIDRNTGQSGDALGLWMAVKNIDLHTACREAMEFCGIHDDRPIHHRKSYRVPEQVVSNFMSAEHSKFLIDDRKLSLNSVVSYRLTSSGTRLMFPYYRGDDLVFAKYRELPKRFSAEKGCEPILFGWQAIPPDARSVVICEGELDALAWHSYGFPALSLPTGAGAHTWIEGEFSALSVFDIIYLSMDMDSPGQRAIPELCERLGRERVRVVELPAKDANECLMSGVAPEIIFNAIRSARTRDPSELRNASEFADEIWNEYTKIDEGIVLPWPKTHDRIKLRQGELSIWAGVNGHGKTTLVSHIVASSVTGGVRCCVASMEWRTPMWLARMGRQIAGTAAPSRMFSNFIAKSYEDFLWTFDVTGVAKGSRILEVFSYARRRYGIDLFVIDNLTKCGFADDDYAGQKMFVEALADFARSSNCHVMLVAHMRKSESEDHPSGKMGVKGSGGITDIASTVVEVWRNKPRERAIARSEPSEFSVPLDPKYLPDGDAGAGTLLVVLKQNATGDEPAVRLWFDRDTTQFLSYANHNAKSMIAYGKAPN